VCRPETAEEKALRTEITNLQIRVEAGEADAEYEGEPDQPAGDEGGAGEGGAGRTVAQALEALEERLARLQLDLDSKARAAGRDEERCAPPGVALLLLGRGAERVFGMLTLPWIRPAGRLASILVPCFDDVFMRCRERPRPRQASPAGEGAWRRTGDQWLL
jgi:hypothetical protein